MRPERLGKRPGFHPSCVSQTFLKSGAVMAVWPKDRTELRNIREIVDGRLRYRLISYAPYRDYRSVSGKLCRIYAQV